MVSSKLSPDNYFHAKVTLRSQYHRIVSQIKSKLTDSQADLFKTTCFGKLVYEAPDLKFNHQMVHQILLREADRGSGNEMWFNLCGKCARFGAEEFCLVTGLELGNAEEALDVLSAKEEEPRLLRVIPSKGKLTFGELLEFFKDCKLDDDNDMVSMALLAFVHGALNPHEAKTFVDKRVFHLAEDFEALNRFPWGSLCHSITLESLRKAVVKCLSQKGSSKTYGLGGFPYAFQVI